VPRSKPPVETSCAPCVRNRNSILPQLTEKRDRCQSHAATTIPFATNAAHSACLGSLSSGKFEARLMMTGSDAELGFVITAFELLLEVDRALAATQGAEEEWSS
jgi:hypothetical protein